MLRGMAEALPPDRPRGCARRTSACARPTRSWPAGWRWVPAAPGDDRVPARARLRPRRRVADRDLDARQRAEHRPLREDDGADRPQQGRAEGGGRQARREDHGRHRLRRARPRRPAGRADVLAPAIEAGAETAIRQQLDRFVASDRFAELGTRRTGGRTLGWSGCSPRGSRPARAAGRHGYLDLSPAVDRDQAGAERPRPHPHRRRHPADRRRADPAADLGRLRQRAPGNQPDQGVERAAAAAGAAGLRRARAHVAPEGGAGCCASRSASPSPGCCCWRRSASAASTYLDAINRDVLPRRRRRTSSTR